MSSFSKKVSMRYHWPRNVCIPSFWLYKSYLFCISWLLLGNVQDGEHWDVYRLVTIGICIAWLPIQFVQVGYQSVQIGNHWDLYRLVTLGFVQFGYHGVVQVSNHRNLYRFLLFPPKTLFRSVCGQEGTSAVSLGLFVDMWNSWGPFMTAQVHKG